MHTATEEEAELDDDDEEAELDNDEDAELDDDEEDAELDDDEEEEAELDDDDNEEEAELDNDDDEEEAELDDDDNEEAELVQVSMNDLNPRADLDDDDDDDEEADLDDDDEEEEAELDDDDEAELDDDDEEAELDDDDDDDEEAELVRASKMAASTEDLGELDLLERVFLRIGSANTDDQLQACLKKFLAPVLLKLASQEDGVRKKVMELLVHVNKRVKSRPKIQLPIDDLFFQYQDTSVSPFVTNFTILYIKIGFPRLPVEKQCELVPTIMNCLEGRPPQQQDSLLQFLMPVLKHLKMSSDPVKRKEMYGMHDKPKSREILLNFMLDYLFLPYNQVAPGRPSSATTPTGTISGEYSSRPQTAPASSTGSGPPAGLSEQAYKRLISDGIPTAEQIEEAKLGIVKFLGADLFPELEVFVHLIIASSDTRHSVATTADMELKRIVGSVNTNDSTFINKIYRVYYGTVKSKTMNPNLKPDQIRSPANTRIRLKIFPYFLKSVEAANTFPFSIQVIFDSLYGNTTNQKLKHYSVQLVHHLCENAENPKIAPVSAVLLSGMVKLIGEAKEDSKLRGYAYMAVGKLVKRCPNLIANDIALLQTMFNAISKEDSETRLSVQEALSMMTSSIKGKVEGTNLVLLEALVMENIVKPEPPARMMAVQFAKIVFPPDHIPSRYVLLLAAGDSKEDINSEAKKALKSILQPDHRHQIDPTTNKQMMPSFTKLVEYINEKATLRAKSSQKYVVGNKTLAFDPVTYTMILTYLRMCLAYNAGVTPDMDSMSSMLSQAPAIGKYVCDLLQQESGDKNGPIQIYVELCGTLLKTLGGEMPLYCLLEIVAVANELMAPKFIQSLDWIKTYMMCSREDMREYAAHLFGILIATVSEEQEYTQTIEELMKNLQKDKEVECRHGSLVALGYCIAYKQLYKRNADVVIEDMETETRVIEQLHRRALNAIGKELLDSSGTLTLAGSIHAVGEMGRIAPLPFPPTSDNLSDEKVNSLSVVQRLVDIVQKTKQSGKIREKAAMTLGYICVGNNAFEQRKLAMEGMLDCGQPNQMELHFTVGEALVNAALGVTAPAARDIWKVDEKEFKSAIPNPLIELEWLSNQLLTKYMSSPNPHIRQAACIWLLTLVKRCGSCPGVRSKLVNIQAAFMNLLTESNELTQDIASKGLGLVYENCSKEQKNELVSVLVDTLMVGKRAPTQVTGETEVFQAGSLGKTPDGGNLSTYKELCSIASDLNQPDLIYKFMHLANHNAMWNSRKGAAFGFSSIAAQAGEQLAPYLHQIVPKLYRYQFDPNPRIQQAMSSIWTALVPDNNKTIEKYLAQITDDLIKNLTNNQWRVRESSCLALADLLRGKPLDDIIERLPELWDTCFRVRDDIKESCRNAADSACKALQRASIKYCDVANGKVGERSVKAVLPSLLKALGSPVEDVRNISLTTLVKISKNAGKLLAPHIPILAVALLESLSGLEPQVMNYLSLHVASSQAAQEKLDNARIAASKMSPMMETINLCVQYVDESVLKELIPHLCDLIRSGIGIGTKAGCCNFIVSLIHQCPQELSPYAGKLMSALLTGLNDRSVSVQKAFANTMGHTVKIAKDSSVEKLVNKLKSWYFEKEDDGVRQACGVALQAMGQHAPDILKRHAAVALPLAFLAMHQEKKPEDGKENENLASVWEDVWVENTPGTEGGVRLYLPELVTITKTGIESQSWHMKAQSAAAMKTVAVKSSSNLKPPHLGNLLQALLTSLSGRTWAGKETLIEALCAICKECKDLIPLTDDEGGTPSIDKILDAIHRESKKERLEYKMSAIKCYGAILETYQIDQFENIYNILKPLLNKSLGSANDSEDTNKETLLKFREEAFLAVGQAWPTCEKTQSTYFEDLSTLFVNMIPQSTWKVQQSILQSMAKLWERLMIEAVDGDRIAKAAANSIPVVSTTLGTLKYISIRKESFNTLEIICKKIRDNNLFKNVPRSVLDELREAVGARLQDNMPELQERAKLFMKTINSLTTDTTMDITQ
ncbi:proteasome adapter and scaffold protein ECM29-like [Tubulanus polymorphus]|uniref:proteasome adapter and scaffold protein ECM29-like n=1 Tax=Tubulanus polymorphus TaxID=672921 RepID=UPI003DA639D5